MKTTAEEIANRRDEYLFVLLQAQATQIEIARHMSECDLDLQGQLLAIV